MLRKSSNNLPDADNNGVVGPELSEEKPEDLFSELEEFFSANTAKKSEQEIAAEFKTFIRKKYSNTETFKDKLDQLLESFSTSIDKLPTQNTHLNIDAFRAYHQKLKEESNSSVDSDSIIAAVGLAFTLTQHTNNLSNNTIDNKLADKNISLGHHFADDLIQINPAETIRKFNGWRFAAGLGLFILGAAVTVTAACSIAATFGVSAPFVVALAKWSLDAFILATIYLAGEALSVCYSKEPIKNKMQLAPVPLSFGGGALSTVITYLAGALPTSITQFSVITGAAEVTTAASDIACVFGSMAASTIAGLSALARGGHLMWSARSKSGPQKYGETHKLATEVLNSTRGAPR